MATKYVTYYRTKDSEEDYKFSFEEQSNGSWLAFILRRPSYNGRSEDCNDTHRLMMGRRYYVCWDRDLFSLDDCLKVAAMWAEHTQEYIRSGRRFG